MARQEGPSMEVDTEIELHADVGTPTSAPEPVLDAERKEHAGIELRVDVGTPKVAKEAPSQQPRLEVKVADQDRKPPARLISLLMLVGALEGADMVLLPCVLFALERDLGLTLSALAVMSMVQALAGNFAAPLWGIMADRGTMQRKTIISVGCVLQGLLTMILAGVDGFAFMMILRALNGAMLAALKPIACGIIADVTSELNRGKVYSSMGVALNLGMMMGSFVGTNLGRKQVLGMQGWRLSFLLVGGASVVVGFIAAAFMEEPPRVLAKAPEGKGWSAVKSEAKEVLGYFRLPSFCVLILQGCFGMVPWNALGYKTLFFQLGGITDFQASMIDVSSQIAGSVGQVLGGFIGDALTRCSRYHGRPITAQVSVLAGIPVAWFIFKQTPPEHAAFVYYLLLMITLGLTATWCGVGVNLPILSEIVKDDRRATIMAWEGALESSCSAIFGNAMVGVLAENVFGYDLNNAHNDAASNDPAKSQALGNALMLVSFVPWILCFVSYSLLHWSYARDMKLIHGDTVGQSSLDPIAPSSQEDEAGEPATGKAQEQFELGSPSKAAKEAPVRLGISAAAQAVAQLEPPQS